MCALALLMTAGAGCGDGVGTPIRRAVGESRAGADAPDAGSPDEMTEPCTEVDTDDWPDDAELVEFQLVQFINQQRRMGLFCDDGVEYGPKQQLDRSPELTCSARLHSRDMARNDFVDGIGSDGRDPGDRMRAAGFALDHGEWSESLVARESDPWRVFEDLLEHRWDCGNIGEGEFTHIGVGFYEGFWTIDYAEHASQNGDEPRRSPPGTF